MIDLILSLDYEIFGNGAGDVRRDMIEPTGRLMDVCERYGARVSIMFEVAEFRAMKEAEEAGKLSIGYSPWREIQQQVLAAAERGHDVQLHVHPAWIGASFEDNHWRLQPQFRGMDDLPGGVGGEDDLFSATGVLSQGKREIESIVRQVRADYECAVYRAGAFWAQPSDKLIAGMKKAGLVADSSVVQGMYEAEAESMDYRHAADNKGYWWTSGDDIAVAGAPGEHIIELPVYSEMKSYLSNFRWTKLKTTLKRRRRERDNMHGHRMSGVKTSTDSPLKIAKKLCTRQPLKFDFCKMSSRTMTTWLKRLIRDNQKAGGDGIMPIVMLGHSKDFWNDKNLAGFLKFVRDECGDTVRMSTFGAVVKAIREKDRGAEGQSAVNGEKRD